MNYSDRYKLATFALVALLPLGMGARGCDHAVVGSECKGDAGSTCAAGCLDNGKRYAVGQSFKSSDGCNQCSCAADGQVLCTLVACDGGKACGARLGDTCSKDEYCDFDASALCGAADGTGTCKQRPQGCRDKLAAVCGCDGKSYDNACSAAVDGTGVMRDGKCAGDDAGTGGGKDGGTSTGGCDYNGQHYAVGDGFKASDGCNSCSCAKDGGVVCTKIACPAPPSCGGLQGKSCATGQYCNFPPDAQCGAADQTGTCAAIPTACTKEYKPVCGCDDNTYGNACTAAAAGVSVVSDGACGTTGGGCDYNGSHYNAGDSFPSTDGCNKCTCGKDGSATCTEIACQTGTTCGGIAGLACKKGEYCDFPTTTKCGATDQTGTCMTIPQVCTDIYMPVCGCDDKTYPNACNANSASVSVAHDGMCTASSGGCDGGSKHYNVGDTWNDGCNSCTCTANGVACTQRACPSCGGLIGAQCPDSQYCKYTLDAICGAADATGVCTPVPQVCDTIYAAVCGCDGMTYSSECVAASKRVAVRATGACK